MIFLKILVVIILFGLPLVPTFWAIQDIPKRRFSSSKRKILWFVLVSTLPFVGAVAYILFERKKTKPGNNGINKVQPRSEGGITLETEELS